MPEYRILTPEQVANTMQVSQKTVYRWISNNQLVASQVGYKTYRIFEEDLILFMAENRVKKVNRAPKTVNYKILTPEQITEIMQVSLKTVYRWIRSNKLLASRVGSKTYRIFEEDLILLMKKNRVKKLITKK